MHTYDFQTCTKDGTSKQWKWLVVPDTLPLFLWDDNPRRILTHMFRVSFCVQVIFIRGLNNPGYPLVTSMAIKILSLWMISHLNVQSVCWISQLAVLDCRRISQYCIVLLVNAQVSNPHPRDVCYRDRDQKVRFDFREIFGTGVGFGEDPFSTGRKVTIQTPHWAGWVMFTLAILEFLSFHSSCRLNSACRWRRIVACHLRILGW